MASKWPGNIIFQILTRLPVKSLVRFKCVCMRWGCMITGSELGDLSLVKMQLERGKEDPHRFKVLLLTSPLLTIVDCEADSYEDCEKGILEVDFPSGIPEGRVELMGSCDGLVCLVRERRAFDLWNPSTRESRVLPEPKCCLKDVSFFGFGYDSSADDYKVVRGVNFESAADRRRNRIDLFTLKSNTWWRIRYDHPNAILTGPGIFASRALHWLTNEIVTSFDLIKERFMDLVSLPDLLVSHDVYFRELCKSGECLCLYCTRGGGSEVEVWMMKEFGARESWSKMHTFQRFRFETPFYSTNSRTFLVHGVFENALEIYDATQETYKSLTLNLKLRYLDAIVYVESLVSPNPQVDEGDVSPNYEVDEDDSDEDDDDQGDEGDQSDDDNQGDDSDITN